MTQTPVTNRFAAIAFSALVVLTVWTQTLAMPLAA
jgi:hypothetical protein